MLSPEQFDDVEKLIRDVGINCIAPYFRNLREGDISYKSSPNDPVSIADKKAEELLRQGLQKILPKSAFIGEESYAINPDIIQNLTAIDTPVWVTDPIDGTQNFVTGKEGFGPMVALIYNGAVVASWTYDVCAHTMLSFNQKQGVRQNGSPLSFSENAENPWRGIVGMKIFKLPPVQGLLHSGKYDMAPALLPSIVAYAKLLTGELDFLVYKFTSCWDHLPGVGMARELGYVAINWSGAEFQVTDLDAGLIVARTPEIAEQVRMDIANQLSQYLDRSQLKA